MTQSAFLRMVRVTLAADQQQAVSPPAAPSRYFRRVVILNGTTDDLYVYTDTVEANGEYLVIASGYERPLTVHDLNPFSASAPAFWLKSTPGGLVVLEWS